jgi:Fe-S-cluster containining protein
MLMQIQKFTCSACGTCCSKIGGFISGSEKRFIEEYGYGRLPLIQIVPADEMTFPLWDFEAKRFREYEAREKIDAKIVPSRGVMDLHSNKFVIVTYQMSSERCPFLLDDGKCRIYDTRRAYVCRFFPFNSSPFLRLSGSNSINFFGVCPNIAEIVKQLDFKDGKQLIKQLNKSFGDTFLNIIQHDFIMEWSNKRILDMMRKKIIKPALNYPSEYLKKRIEESEKIDFFDFLVESGYKTKEQAENLIQRFENLEDAKAILRQYGISQPNQ